MKIVLVGRYGDGDILTGPERVARELFSELTKNNIQAVFVDYYFSGYEGSSLLKKIFGKEYIHNSLILRLGIFPFLFMLHQKKIEIIHIVNSQRFILFLLLLNPFFSGRIVTTVHGFIRNEIPAKNIWKKRYFVDLWVEKLLAKKSNLLIFPSKLLFETFNKHYKISQKKYQIIPNGVSKSFLENERQFPTTEKSLKLVFYNGLDKSINRGLQDLLFLLEKIKYEIELFIIGEQKTINHSSNIKIVYLPPTSHNELITFLKDKHFVIKSVSFDSFSVFVAECMSLGLIPLISDNVGVKDFIEHNVNGFVYDSNSNFELADLLNQIAEGKYDLCSISANAKKTSGRFNWGKITQEYISAYKSTL